MRTAVAARTEPVDRILAVVDAQGSRLPVAARIALAPAADRRSRTYRPQGLRTAAR
jgi:hypothetical protein